MISKFNKKLITIIGLLTSINTYAYDFEVDGIYYNIISLSELTCEVTYKDTNYNSYKGEISIPEIVTYQNREITVVSIGAHAFYDCYEVESISIPNSVTQIGEYAFYGCDGLTEVNISDLSAWCKINFYDYPLLYATDNVKLKLNGTEITNLVIPNDISQIKNYAFCGYNGLTSITIPNSVAEIGDYAFSGCSGLTSVTIPNSVTEIGNGAFNACTGLTELIFADGKETLSLGYDYDYDNYGFSTGQAQFYDCPLEKLYLGRNLSYNANKQYGYSPFYNKSTLKTATISSSVTYIYGYAFSGCSGLTSITIPNSVTDIYHYAFDDCTNLAELIIEDGKEALSLGYSAYDKNLFNDCPLKTLYLGRNLSEESSSISMKYLSQLTIGENIDNLTRFNFKYCNQLCTIESKNMTPPTIGEFSNASYLNTLVIIPHGSINSYLAANVWKNFWNISEAGIESTICDDDISLTIKNGNIIINNIDSPQVEVYNINGQIVYKGNSTIIPVSTNGLYFVKINNKSYKVIL